MSYTVEQFAVDCARQKCNAELLYDPNTANPNPFGIRVRFFGKGAPKDKMAWGVGADYDEAAFAVVMAVKRRQFLQLNWSYRPWEEADDAESPDWMV